MHIWMVISLNLYLESLTNMKYKDLFSLKNKVSVITGSTGILGKVLSSALAENGSNIALIDLDKGKLSRLSKNIIKKYKVKCKAYVCDVSDEDQVKKTIINIEKDIGKIDVLLNNAATKTDSLNSTFAVENMRIPSSLLPEQSLVAFVCHFFSSKSSSSSLSPSTPSTSATCNALVREPITG